MEKGPLQFGQPQAGDQNPELFQCLPFRYLPSAYHSLTGPPDASLRTLGCCDLPPAWRVGVRLLGQLQPSAPHGVQTTDGYSQRWKSEIQLCAGLGGSPWPRCPRLHPRPAAPRR